MFRERGVGRGEWTGHHRTGGQHAAFPGESLHLPTDGGGTPQPFDRDSGIGYRRLGLLHISLGLSEHRGHREVSKRRGREPSEQGGIVGQHPRGQGPRRGQFERHESANAFLHVRRHRRITAEQHQRVGAERFERERDSARHPFVPQRTQASGRHLPGLVRLRHAGHQQRERLCIAGNVTVIMPGHDLRSLHAPPGDHHPRPGRLQHHGLHFRIARLRRRRKPSCSGPGFEQLQLQVHGE